MSLLYHTEDAPQSVCWDRYNYSSFDDQLEKVKNSRTVYVGNLSYYTTELQIQETFQLVGIIDSLTCSFSFLLLALLLYRCN